MSRPVRRVRRPAHGGAHGIEGLAHGLTEGRACRPQADSWHPGQRPRRAITWLFDLDNTLHDATEAVFAPTSAAMTDYIAHHLGLAHEAASALRIGYWKRYGATLLGMVRHHGVSASHFLEETHRLPGLEQRLRCRSVDRRALRRLPGRRLIVTNGPRSYARRVLRALRLHGLFDGVVTVEDMRMVGEHRPKPDRRMLRHLAARLRLRPAQCVLVEDTLANARAAQRVGMRAVWMQGYQRPAPAALRPPAGGGRPAGVCARIKRIAALCALPHLSR